MVSVMVSRARALGVVIVGGNGFLGSHLARSLRKRARVVVTYAKNPVPLEGVLSLPIDVRDVGNMRKVLYAQKPDAVIYLAGSEDPEWVKRNPKMAEKIITSGAGDVLHAAEIMAAKFLYVSCSNVFDGTRGNYLETDHISPMNFLGKLKASGETLVRGRSNSASVLRLSPLVGSSHPWRPSLFDRLRKALESRNKFELRDDEYHSWASVSSTVSAIEAMIDRAPKSVLYHFGGLTRLTPFEMGQLFAKNLGYSEEIISKTIVAKKRVNEKGMIHLPEGEKFDYSLNCSAIIRALEVKAYPIEVGIRSEFTF
jgi:dTDP-4-dehydrorhamnose reductase